MCVCVSLTIMTQNSLYWCAYPTSICLCLSVFVFEAECNVTHVDRWLCMSALFVGSHLGVDSAV